tara:strand:+ start:8433 stop:9830 length:1398 start_codon:yes stop_codon:yes gene_type:complete
MAYTISQSTTGVQGAADDLIYVVTGQSTTPDNFRYVLKIELDGVEVILLKQLPNNALSAVFNIKSIVSNYVVQDDNPYQLGAFGLDGTAETTKQFSVNTSALKTFDLIFGYEESSSPTSTPVVTYPAGATEEVKCVNGSFLAPTISSPPLSTVASAYGIDNNQALFLSDIAPVPNSTQLKTSILYDGSNTQWAALAFLNGNDVGSANSSYIFVTYYKDRIELTQSYFTNTSTQGGELPAATLTDAQSLLYFGCGTANLEAQTTQPLAVPSATSNTDWTHYDIQFSSAPTLDNTHTSKKYRFERVTCGKYVTDDQTFSVHWWNSKGGIDNLPLLGKVQEVQEIKKKDYRTSGGNGLSANGVGADAYVKQSWMGGKRSTKVHANTILELTTIGGNPDLLNPMMRSLLNSERVFLSGNSLFGSSGQSASNGVVQAYVLDTQQKKMTGLNDGAVSYTLKIEISRRRANP